MKDRLHGFLAHVAERVDTARTWYSLLLRAAFIHFPFLVLFIAVALLSIRPEDLRTYADSGDYLKYAEWIVESAKTGTNHITSIWFGPGYPLLLVPAVVLGRGLIPAMLVSPVLLYGATILLFLAARRFLTTMKSLVVSSFHAMYLPYLTCLHGLWSEPLAVFLICGICSAVPLIFIEWRVKAWLWPAVFAAVSFAYLSLTKPLFGYVLSVLFLLSLMGLLLRRSMFWRRSLVICGGAAVLSLPYLGWTYHLTGKAFYWGSSGGSSLYPMSTGYPGEYGNWISPRRCKEGERGYVAAREQTHYKLFDQWNGLTEVECDNKLKEVAVSNIRRHPITYARNMCYNASRLLLNFPYSYELEKPTTLSFIVPNMFLIVGGVICVILSVFCHVNMPSWTGWLGIVGAIYLMGTLMLSAYARMLFPLVPILVLWEAYILDRCVLVRADAGAIGPEDPPTQEQGAVNVREDYV